MAVETAGLSAGPRDHVVQFYEREDQLVATVTSYLVDALRAGEVAVVRRVIAATRPDGS